MLLKKEERLCKILLKIYSKQLIKYLVKNPEIKTVDTVEEYMNRFYKYINTVDMGENREKFKSYLNIFSGLAAYEILREKGLSEYEAIQVYDKMCFGLRTFARVLFKIADILPNGYNIVKKSIYDDLKGPQGICWKSNIIEDTEKKFTYEIYDCLYYNVCKTHGYPEFCSVFCNHDNFTYGCLKHHTIFERKSTIANGDSCCHDSLLKVK